MKGKLKMVIVGYGVCLVVSILATLLFALRNDDRVSSYDWSISLLLPFIIMALSSLIMSLVHGVVGLVLGLLQIVVYLVVGYTVFASSTNS